MSRFMFSALLITFTTAWGIYAHYKKILGTIFKVVFHSYQHCPKYHKLTNLNVSEKEYGTWRRIGTLNQIVLYPLEGPQGIKILPRAYCSIYGLTKHLDERDETKYWLDRSHVLYSKSTYIAVTLDPKLIKQPIETIWKILSTYWGNKYLPDSREIPINYLGNEIFVCPLPGDVSSQIYNNVENYGNDLKVGLTPKPFRSSLTPQTVGDIEYDGFESNFSTYTLINLRSLEALQVISERDDLTYKNFLPNLVIDCPDYESYIEDCIKQLRIGEKVLFENVRPCTHTKFIDANPDRGRNFSGLFEVLQSTRTLNRLFPRLSNSNSPVFGINLEIINHTGFVNAGDDVYATFQFDRFTYATQIKEIASHINKDIRRMVSSIVNNDH